MNYITDFLLSFSLSLFQLQCCDAATLRLNCVEGIILLKKKKKKVTLFLISIVNFCHPLSLTHSLSVLCVLCKKRVDEENCWHFPPIPNKRIQKNDDGDGGGGGGS
jgi:hypothetical protein